MTHAAGSTLAPAVAFSKRGVPLIDLEDRQ
jgi:hypothetical protein